MFFLNKIAWMLANPLVVAMVAVATGTVLVARGRRRSGLTLVALALAGLWGMSTGVVGGWLGLWLENDFPHGGPGYSYRAGEVVLVEEVPTAEAIVLLGGGMWANTNAPYADIQSAADRVWFAAKLWKAGKAPIIVPSGPDIARADATLLTDLGVPASAIVNENAARNTEENAKKIVRTLMARLGTSGKPDKKIRVLVVTSACHMKRSLLMFEKYAPELEAIPAPTDFETTMVKDEPLQFGAFLPHPGTFARVVGLLHEYAGYLWYRWVR